jgi:CRP-like cAMP-binding protein
VSATAFKRELQASAALQKELNRYLYVLMTQLAQSAACMRFHLIEARLARWLLMTQDRSRTDRFRITHAFLAWMLGVRRAGVTKAARALQARGLLTYKHGNVTVLNRPGLESAACACYQADRTLYRSVLG